MQLLLQQGEAGRLGGLDGLGVLDQVPELAVAVLAERGVQRDRLAGVLRCTSMSFSRGHVPAWPRARRGWARGPGPAGPPLHPGQRAGGLGHVHRKADRAGLLGHRPGDRLPDPPGGVRGELVAPGVIELLHRPDQAQVPSWIRSRNSIPRPAYRRATETTRRRLASSRWSLALLPSSATRSRSTLWACRAPAAAGELLLGEQARFDPLGQLDLLPGGEQRHLADLPQVVLHRARASALAAATRGAGRPSSSSPETHGSSRLCSPAACGGRAAAAATSPFPSPGSCLPAASRGARGSSRAAPECAISIRAAGSGPPISASLSPPGSAGSVKPMAAPATPPAATASCGLRASPAAAAPATSGERPGSCREHAARARLADAVPGACRACHRDHPAIAGPQRAVPGPARWPAWALARGT